MNEGLYGYGSERAAQEAALKQSFATVGQMAANATRYDSPVVATSPVSMGHVVQLLVSQSNELRERVANVASNICGPVPEPPSGQELKGPDCLIDVLQMVSRQLQRALSEMERIQSRL